LKTLHKINQEGKVKVKQIFGFDFAFSSVGVDPTNYDKLVEPKGYKEAWNHPDEV
jgi:hypothetical protein